MEGRCKVFGPDTAPPGAPLCLCVSVVLYDRVLGGSMPATASKKAPGGM